VDAGPRFSLGAESAARFAPLALRCIRQEFPYQPQHVITGPDDARRPRDLHPAFYGCFDWHSAVHGHWLLARVLRRFPGLPEADQVRAALSANLTSENLQAEAGYFQARPGFERPYGWAWLLKLAQELAEWDDADARSWSQNVKPLADVVEARYLDFFPRQTYPIRSGVHSNTAFGLAFAWDYARALGHESLRDLVERRGRDYFLDDRGCPAAWEPGGGDFFSPCLIEADLMRRLLPAVEFARWLDDFLPELRDGGLPAWLSPVSVVDRRDGQLVHLDGLNLSRAWCLRQIARALPEADPRRDHLGAIAARHAESGLAHVTSGDYMGEHWLATFAVYMLECAAGAG
jgi:hypothetical protein